MRHIAEVGGVLPSHVQMKTETQKLISNLKKEIEKKKKKYSLNRKGMTNLEKAQIRKEIKLKQAKLEGVKEGIEAIRKDMKKIVKKEQEETKNLFRDWSHETIRRAVYRSAIENLFLEIIKILNEAIEKCQN